MKKLNNKFWNTTVYHGIFQNRVNLIVS